MVTNVVIGAASGMGTAVATRLGSSEGKLLLVDVDAPGAEKVASSIAGDVEVLRADLRSSADIDAVVRATGNLGALVVTAGLSPSMASGRRIYEVNLLGPAHLLGAFESTLAPGSVGVLFASMAAHQVPPMPNIDAILDQPLAGSFFDDLAGAGLDVDEPGAAYALSKRGVIRLVQRKAARWGALGARILSLSPGIVDTRMGRLEAANQPVMAGMVTASALRRELQADEVAAVVAFLVTAAASAMTGTDVLVDGGAIAGLTHQSTGEA